MNRSDFKKYFNVHVEMTIDTDSKLTGAVVDSRRPDEGETLYYFIPTRELLDYKVAHLQNDEEAMLKIEQIIDISKIEKVRMLKVTEEITEKYRAN